MEEINMKDISTIFISCVALFFSYCAYRFSRERFRLELLDKRWEVYEQVLKFCSVVMTHGGLPGHGNEDKNEWRNESVLSGLKAAHESFRGIGYHKARSLFGEDIHDEFDRLNKTFAWLVSKPRPNDWVEIEHKHIKYVIETATNLPKLFKPYVYFGDFKK